MAAVALRLVSLTVAGFRAFSEEQTFDLDADVLIVKGPNGSGKTSLLDAILWGISGKVERIGPDSDLVSQYSEFGEARVELVLRSASVGELRITRRYDGRVNLLLEIDGERHSGPTAEARLLDVLWPDGRALSAPWVSLSRSMTQAIYLQQDLVRSFVEAEDDQGRFGIVEEIVGAGRVGELIRQLETSRKAWTAATNRLKGELEPIARRNAALRSRVLDRSSSPTSIPDVDREWSRWSRNVAELLGSGFESALLSEGAGRGVAIERILVELRSAQRVTESEASQVRELLELLGDRPEPVEGAEIVRAQLEIAEDELLRASMALDAASGRAVLLRQERVAAQQDRESLAAMAQIALRHLDGACPVCEQPHDRAHTAAHLAELVGALAEPFEDPQELIDEESERVAAAQRLVVTRQGETRELERAERRVAEWDERLRILADELQLGGDSVEGWTAAAESLRAEGATRLSRIQEARAEGERLSIGIARAAEASQVASMEAQLIGSASEVSEREAEIELREAAGADAKQLHDALRQIAESLVSTELERIEPVVQRIYASVDPHPSFRAVRFLTRMHRGRGRMWTALEDSLSDLTVEEPRTVLSSSQLNVLAVVTFLSLNLSVATLPLQLVALDDPLQSLDSVNLLGLSDLLRRLRRSRQVIVSTHDEQLGGLLERKLRPVGLGERTVVIGIEAWTRSGPSVIQRDVGRDDGGLRLVATG